MTLLVLIAAAQAPPANQSAQVVGGARFGAPWARHTIDDTSRGADGVRLADVNGDGRADIATGWEEGGVIRVYLNPGPARAKERWPVVTVGKVASPEDAVFTDLDGDGAIDVVSSCEGRNRTMYVHWAPKGRTLDSGAWRTDPIPVTRGAQMWMFALPMQVDGKNGVDLVVGSKGKGASIGWLEAPPKPRELSAWRYHRLYEASWIMSLRAVDLDGDGDRDILASDRKGKTSKVLWLENGPWTVHTIGAERRQVMFIDLGDLDGDGRADVVAPVPPRTLLLLSQPKDPTGRWPSREIAFPDRFGTSKAARVADVDLDGQPDLVVTCENAKGERSGAFWMRRKGADWVVAGDIGGPKGHKYDRIEMIDLDGDGDLDLLTCEERDNLGVFWYENPAR